jgi:hypothetical protein
MRYKSPPLPVDLAFTSIRNNVPAVNGSNTKVPFDTAYAEEVAAMFEIRK